MNNNPSHFGPDFDAFLAEIIEFIDPDAIASMNPRDAQRILDDMPDGAARDAMRDAFRDNIDCPDDTDIPLA